MDNLTSNIYLLLIIAIIGFIYQMLGAVKIEENLPGEHRKKLGQKLLDIRDKGFNVTVSSSLNDNWLFLWLFGPKPWSLRCFIPSAVFTVIFTFLGFLMIWGLFNEYEFKKITGMILSKDNRFYFLLALFANIFIDFLSLLETRWVIGKIREDSRIINTIMLICIDLVFTYLIFIVFFSIFKTGLDLYEFYPYVYKQNEIIINHGGNISVTLSINSNWLQNYLTLLVPTLEYSFISTWEVLNGSFEQYWFSTLFLPEEKQVYVMHASTLWLTTHLSSIWIYFSISIWVLIKVLSFIKYPIKIILPRTLDPKIYPYHVILLNILLIFVGGLLVSYIFG